MRKVFRWIDRGAEYGVAAIFAAMCLIGLLQVFNRFVLNQSISWSEEFQIYCHVWIVFLGIPIAYRRGAHFTVVGAIAKKGRVLGQSFDGFVMMPITTFETMYGRRQTTTISVKMTDPSLIADGMARTCRSIR